MFKAGEKVIHHRFGEGVLEANTAVNEPTYPLVFRGNCALYCLTYDGKHHEDDLYPSIYYVPQTLDMSKPEPEIGTWGYFWDREKCAVVFSELKEVNKYSDDPYVNGLGHLFKHFSPEIPPHIKTLMDGGKGE